MSRKAPGPPAESEERAGPEFVVDGRGGVTVWVDGQPQSHVQPDDPELLAFEYVQHLAIVVDVLAAQRDQRLRVTHIGGAGLTLARYVEHVVAGSPQIVLEPDAALTDLVRRELPLPRGHRIRVRPIDGRHGVAALANASADLAVLDAFAGGSIPPELTTVEFLADAARVLAADGVLALNIPDERGRGFLTRVLATLAATPVPPGARAGPAYAEVVVIGTHDVLKGRRFGNYVVVAARGALPVDELRRRLARSPFPTGLWDAARVRQLAAGARPLTDADPARSPTPPDPGRWRAL